MVGIVDVARTFVIVKIGEQTVECYGISVKKVAELLVRFPELKMIVVGLGSELTVEAVLTFAPNAVATIIAMGTLDESEAGVEAASNFPMEVQFNLLEGIQKATMPGGAIPFMERLRAMNNTLDEYAGTVAQIPAKQ